MEKLTIEEIQEIIINCNLSDNRCMIDEFSKFIDFKFDMYNTKALVYQLGDFYIGKSTNFRMRIVTHILDSLFTLDNTIECNENKRYKILEHLHLYGKLTVHKLDNNPFTETHYIYNLSSKLKLTNVVHNPNKHKDFITDKSLLNKVSKYYNKFNDVKSVKEAMLKDKYDIIIKDIRLQDSLKEKFNYNEVEIIHNKPKIKDDELNNLFDIE